LAAVIVVETVSKEIGSDLDSSSQIHISQNATATQTGIALAVYTNSGVASSNLVVDSTYTGAFTNFAIPVMIQTLDQRNAFSSASFTGTTTTGSFTVTGVSSTAGLTPGIGVVGSGIPSGTVITSIDSASQIHISQAATASATVTLQTTPATEQDVYGTIWLTTANSQGVISTTNPPVATFSGYSIISRFSARNVGADFTLQSSNFVNDQNFHGIQISAGDAINPSSGLTEYVKGDALRVTVRNQANTVDAFTNILRLVDATVSGNLPPNDFKSRVIWDNKGRLLISPTSINQTVPVTELDVVTSTTTNTRGVSVRAYNSDGGPGGNVPALLTLYRAQGTADSPSAVGNGSTLGVIAFSGYDGTTGWSTSQINVGALIGALSTGAWSNTSHPARLSFQVTAAASTIPTERMALFQDGGLTIGSPTGSSQGAGTVNVATNLFKNGTAYNNPDYVLEHWATGRVERFKDRDGAAPYDGLRPLAEVMHHVRTHFVLPRIAEAREANGGRLGLFDGGDAVLATLEEAYLYLDGHEQEIARLQERVMLLESLLLERRN
jgi:hypothetical protein